MRKVLYAILAISLVNLVISGVLAFIFEQSGNTKLYLIFGLLAIFDLFVAVPIAIQKIQKLNALEKRLPTFKERQIKKVFCLYLRQY